MESPLTYFLMKQILWLSIYLGIAILMFCIVLGLSMPETLKMKSLTAVEEEEEVGGNPSYTTGDCGIAS
jgi:hypothetical protein